MSTLTLSGWTQPTDAIANALPEPSLTFDYSDYASPEASFEGLKKFIDSEHIVAWSLGGQLAVRAIIEGVLKPKHLTLIAPPYQFVRSSNYSQAMDPETFRLFRENYAADPARTKTRFHALVAKGDREMKRVLPLLGHHQHVENTARWLPWLDHLGADSLAESNLQALPPTLLIHGSADAIVPVAQSEQFESKVPHMTRSVWQGVAHAPHVSDPARLWQEITAHRKAHA